MKLYYELKKKFIKKSNSTSIHNILIFMTTLLLINFSKCIKIYFKGRYLIYLQKKKNYKNKKNQHEHIRT